VSLIHNKLSSRVLLALLTALPFLLPGGNAHAQTRTFQVSLWENGDTSQLVTDPPAYTDIRSFGDQGQTQPNQPPGLSIMLNVNTKITLNSLQNVDWSRIVAVEVDEPYGQYDNDLGTCNNPNPAIATMANTLGGMATELSGLNSKARFWVTFTGPEANWMVNCGSTAAFNRSYIDVMGLDDYNNDVDEPWYNLVLAYPLYPSQQAALIPGVFSAPTNQLSYLQSFFQFANSLNQTCNLPVGSRGISGIYDGCPVWIVMGWMTGVDGAYNGIFVSGSASILAAWQAEVALMPVTPKLQKAKVLQPIINLLLH
jgi:hypothetical protein